MARKRLSDYHWRQDEVNGHWLLRINDAYSFIVAPVQGKTEEFMYSVHDEYLGFHGKEMHDCCCECAKWKCVGFLERGEWAKLAPGAGSNEP